LSDVDAERVRLDPVDTTIHDLVRLAPSRREPHGRRRSEELQTYRVQGVLLAVQSRLDKDLHLLLSDPSDSKSRLIAEIPKPSCSMRSLHEDEFAAARNIAESLRWRPQGQTLVEVVGVGFFDVGHIQAGRSHNGLELHPVLSVAAIEPPGL